MAIRVSKNTPLANALIPMVNQVQHFTILRPVRLGPAVSDNPWPLSHKCRRLAVDPDQMVNC